VGTLQRQVAGSSSVSDRKGIDGDLVKIPFARLARPYIILAPALLLTIGILVPFAMAVYYSFTNFSFKYSDYSFIGFRNWAEIYASSKFWHSFGVTLTYSASATIVQMVLGMAIALLLNQENLLARSLRIVLIFPLMIAPVVATLIWQLMTNQSMGVYSKLLKMMGIEFNWAADPSSAMFTVVLVDTWVYTPFVIILVLAGLRSLPKSPFEASQIDGGSAWFTFKNLTFPMIKPMLLIALLFRLMQSLQEFSVIFVMTRGGPGDKLMSLPILAYTEAFAYKEMGYAIPFMLTLWIFIYAVSHYMVKYWSNTQKRAAGQ